MAESGASPSPPSPLENNDTTLERSHSEPMEADVEVAETDASLSEALNAGRNEVAETDASLSEALNAGRNEVAVVTSLRDPANSGAKEMIVDESHRSEAVTPSQAPAPAEPLVSKDLKDSRTELLQRVQALKKDLESWRGKLDTQVKSYREELGDLRSSLNSEVEQLRVEVQDLRNTLKQQREVTSTKLAKLDEPSEPGMKSNLALPTAAVKTEE